MRGSELRSTMEELESRLQSCGDDRERQELRQRIEELEAEIRRRSSIGRSGRSPSDRDSHEPGDRPLPRRSEKNH
jgi:hypothetical protein